MYLYYNASKGKGGYDAHYNIRGRSVGGRGNFTFVPEWVGSENTTLQQLCGVGGIEVSYY